MRRMEVGGVRVRVRVKLRGGCCAQGWNEGGRAVLMRICVVVGLVGRDGGGAGERAGGEVVG